MIGNTAEATVQQKRQPGIDLDELLPEEFPLFKQEVDDTNMGMTQHWKTLIDFPSIKEGHHIVTSIMDSGANGLYIQKKEDGITARLVRLQVNESLPQQEYNFLKEYL